jgi:hypothetical protein
MVQEGKTELEYQYGVDDGAPQLVYRVRTENRFVGFLTTRHQDVALRGKDLLLTHDKAFLLHIVTNIGQI